ncbi:MAG: J domain-containing protein [Armatimonadota bacterium]
MRLPIRDYYSVLGVKPTATHEDIRRAYRELARKYHPDVAGSNTLRLFQEITEAHTVIGDPVKRRQYDDLVALNEQSKRGAGDIRTESQRKSSPKDESARKVTHHLHEARIALAKGDYKRAAEQAERCNAIDSRNAQAYEIRADVALARGQRDQAAQLYSMAVQYSPQNPSLQRKYNSTIESRPSMGAAQVMVLIPRILRALGMAIGWATVGAAVFSPMIFGYQGTDTLIRGDIGIKVFTAIAAACVIAGLTLSLSGQLSRLSTEIWWPQISRGRSPGVPGGGIIMLLGSIAFPILAVAFFYLGIALRRYETKLLTLGLVVISIVCCFVLTVQPQLNSIRSQATELFQFLWIGCSLGWFTSICGWAIGDAIRQSV